MVERRWQVGGQQYEYAVAAACGVCVWFRRDEVDAQLAAGRCPADLVTEWSYTSGPTVAELREHVALGHVPVDQPPASVAAATEVTPRVLSLGSGVASVDEGDVVGFAEKVLSALSVRIEAGEVQPTMRDGLAAANLLARLDAIRDPAGYVEESTVFGVMEAWGAAAKKVMTGEQMRTFGQILNQDPLLLERERERRRCR